MGIIPNNVKGVSGTKYDALVWLIIGKPTSGKSTFANSFPNPLLINTDGNYFQFDTPHIHINKDGVKVQNAEGETVTYDAWDYFKATISELLTQGNTQGYQTLILDLVEDLYEMCRLNVCKAYGKTHESEIGGFGIGYKAVADEFLGVMLGAFKLREAGWNVIMLSHETTAAVKTLEAETVDTQYATALRTKVQNKLIGYSQLIGRTDTIKREEQTSSGLQTHVDYILWIEEQHSIASNRFNFGKGVDKIYLSYQGWRNLVESVKKEEANVAPKE